MAVVNAPSMNEEALVKAAAEMVPRLRERAPQGDVLCRTPDETIAEVEAAGLHMATCPRSRGGAQVSMQTLVDIQTEIGKGDGGTSWTVAVYHASGHWLGGFSDEAQDEFFSSANPKAAAVFSAGATARPVSGGFQLTGRWPFPSGQHHSGWI